MIDISTISFNIYENTSKFSMRGKRWLSRLALFILAIVFLGLMVVIHGLLSNCLNDTANTIVMVVLAGLMFFLQWYSIRAIFGKLNLVGKIEFNNEAMVISGKINRKIDYEELIYLSTIAERPVRRYYRFLWSKAYIVFFKLESDEEISIIVNRWSNPNANAGQMELFIFLTQLRKQNHHLYTALRGISEYEGLY